MVGPHRALTPGQLRAEGARLGPWHLDVEVTPEVSTAAFLDGPSDADETEFGEVAFVSSRAHFIDLMTDVFPRGLGGREVLDCACNCGAFLFWAKELGAGRCYGFDIRDHWIAQARFLASHRTRPSTGIEFGVHDLYDIPKLELEPFDITNFQGIFYHLPDPVTGLKIAADLTRELLILNTATTGGSGDTLVAAEESETWVMSGVYGLNWLPTGDEVLRRILAWCGFPHARVKFHDRPDEPYGRIEILAARREETFSSYDALARLEVSVQSRR